MAKLLSEVRNSPPSRKPPKNPFTIAMWDDIQALMMADQSLTWLTWSHPDAALLAAEPTQMGGLFGAPPPVPMAMQDRVHIPRFGSANQPLHSGNRLPQLWQPESRGSYQTHSGVSPSGSPAEEISIRTQGLHPQSMLGTCRYSLHLGVS